MKKKLHLFFRRPFQKFTILKGKFSMDMPTWVIHVTLSNYIIAKTDEQNLAYFEYICSDKLTVFKVCHVLLQTDSVVHFLKV